MSAHQSTRHDQPGQCPDCGGPRFVFNDPDTGPELVCEECYRVELTEKGKATDTAFLRQYTALRQSIFRKPDPTERKRSYRVAPRN